MSVCVHMCVYVCVCTCSHTQAYPYMHVTSNENQGHGLERMQEGVYGRVWRE